MDSKEFRIRGKEMIDLVADYLDSIEKRDVVSKVKPGYLKDLIPDHVPEEPDKWEDLVSDIERVIMPGVTHWHHPNFHAYFAAGNSFEIKAFYSNKIKSYNFAPKIAYK